MSYPVALNAAEELALARARVQALEAALARAVQEAVSRGIRLVELEGRLKALEARQRWESDQVARHGEPAETSSTWRTHADLARLEGGVVLTLQGVALGLASLGEEPPFVESLAAIDLYCRMMGLDPALTVQMRVDGRAADWALPTHPSPWPTLSIGATLDVRDVWFTGEHDLSLRLESRDAVVVRAWQCDLAGGGALALAGEALLPAGHGIVDLALLNPFLPLLISVSHPQGPLLASGMVPFPSLCRGGLHHGEVCAFEGTSSGFDALRLLSQQLLGQMFDAAPPLICKVQVDLQGAIGTEPLFQPDFQDWLASVLGVTLTPAPSDESVPAKDAAHSFLVTTLDAPRRPLGWRQQVRASGVSLVIPCDGIPSLQSLLARATTPTAPDLAEGGLFSQPVGFVACDEGAWAPRWAVTPPRVPWSQSLPPAQTAGWPRIEGTAAVAAVPMALRFLRTSAEGDARFVLPPGPSVARPLLAAAEQVSGRISVLLAEDAQALVASLALQSAAADLEIVRDDSEGDRVTRLNRAAARATGDYFLLADPVLALHDPHVLAILRLLVSRERVATAGCTLLAQALRKDKPVISHQGGALHACAPSFEPDGFQPREMDLRALWPFGVWPVVANLRLFMTSAATWYALRGLYPEANDADLDYAQRASAQGWLHLHTVATSASDARAAQRTDPPVPSARPATAPHRPTPSPQALNLACHFRELRP